MRSKGSAEELEARRFRSVEFFQERKPLAEIAETLHVSKSSLRRWKKAWKEGGLAAIAAKTTPPARHIN